MLRLAASRVLLFALTFGALALPRRATPQTCDNTVSGTIEAGDGSVPIVAEAFLAYRLGGPGGLICDVPYRCRNVPWGDASMQMPYEGTYEFQGSAGDYFATPWEPGVTCTACPGGGINCPGGPGGFSLRLFATAGNFLGSVHQMPEGIPLANVPVEARPGYVTHTDSLGAYNFTVGQSQQIQMNNWGVAVSGDGSGPGYGTYDLVANSDDRTLVSATTQSSRATEVNFSVWSGFEQPTRCENPDSNSGPGSGEVSLSIPTEPEPDPPACAGCAVGFPVSVTTGVVYFDHTDAVLPGVGPGLRFVRSYNSQLRAPGQHGIFGEGWNHVYEQKLTVFPPPSKIIMLRRANGSPAYFQDNDGDGTFEPSVPFNKASTIVKQADGTYIRYFRRGGSETYDGSGWLTGLKDPSNNTVTVTRDGSGQLTTITEIGGRTLTLGYLGGLVNTLSGPSGLIATYGYNGFQLASVTYADGSGYTYTYDSGTQQLLTVGDLTGRTLETHTYFADGRAHTSEIADGKELQTLSYGNLQTTVTDALNHVTTYDYRMIWGSWHVIKIVGPCPSCGGGGETQEWTYDNYGRVLSYTDGEGNATTYTYTSDTGDLETETRSPAPGVSHLTQYEYQADGRLFQRTDPNGKTTTWTSYVPAGPQTITEKVSATQDRITGLSYWPQGQVHFLTDPRNKVWEFSYFSVGDLQSVKGPLGKTTSFEYDLMGRRTKTILPPTTPPTNPTVTTYNVRGQVTLITNPNTSYTEITYDYGGRRVSFRDALGHMTTYGYSPYGRLKTVTYLGTTVVARFAYDVMGHLTSVTDARQKVTIFDPDAYGRVQSITYPDARSESFTYDHAGRIETHTDRNGILTTFTYDGLGRLKGKTYTSGNVQVMPPATFTYDENGYVGSLTTATNEADTLTWTYDLAREPLTETSTSNASTVSYTYDLAGNRSTLDDGLQTDRLILMYGYDDAGRLATIGGSAGTFTLGYDEASRRRTLTHPNHVVKTYTPDDLSRLAEVKTTLGTSVIARAAYTYDDIWNRRSKTTEAFADVYTPDDWNRLVQVTRGGTTTETYTYDAVGNRLSSLSYPTWTYDDGNRLQSFNGTTFGYDSNGNVTSKIGNGSTWNYEWNAENQLKRVLNGSEVARFSYDPLGRRVKKVAGSTTTTWTYDGQDILRQVAGSSTLRYLHGPGVDEPFALQDLNAPSPPNCMGSGPRLTSFHADGLGSIVKTTDCHDTVTTTRQYDAFGNLELGATSGYSFTGREWDSETGLYYYRARYYDPKIGRFISEDPFGFRADVNFYRYVYDNPVSWVDPYGLIGESDMKSFGPKPRPPTPLPPVTQVARDAEAKYFDPGKDPYLGGFRHCMAGCLLRKRYGLIGTVIVNWYDLLNEPGFWDSQNANSLSDMAAEQHGLQCGSKPGDCETECLKVYLPANRGGRPYAHIPGY